MAFSSATAPLAPLRVKAFQDADGRSFFCFGTIPLEVIFPSPPPTFIGAPTLASMQQPLGMITREEDDDEPCFIITKKGIENNILSSPPKSQRSRRRVYKKKTSSTSQNLTVMAPIKVTKKWALQAYQDELVAHSDLPVSNSFMPLRIVKKNSPTACIRTVWEIPQPKPVFFSSQSRRTVFGPKRADNPATAIQEAHKTLRNKQQCRNRHRPQPVPSNSRRVYLPRELGTQL